MKSIKRIVLSSLLTLSAFSAIIYYTACNKDKCKDVTCQNGGTCSGGTCTCPTGSGGPDGRCEIVYRSSYTNTYVGTGSDNGTPVFTYTNWRFIFAVPSSSTDFTTMSLTVQDNTGSSVGIPVLTIVLSNITASGATFTINSAVNGTDTYTGTGTISGTTASAIITQTPSSGSALTYTFSSLAKS